MAWGRTLCAVILVFTSMARAEDFYEDFQSLDPSVWHTAHYRFSHPHFDTDWDRRLAEVKSKRLILTLEPQSGQPNRFIGASVRRQVPTGFGRYEAAIQPARGAGVVTGFFTYTGPAYGTRHDEIDIEFLGKNTRQIHIATFVDGKLWNKFIDLPFDAADAPRRYGFDWRADRIDWYVGDRLIYSLVDPAKIPQIPSLLFANIWAADPKIAIWSGTAATGTQAQATMGDIRYTPTNLSARSGNAS